MKILYLKLKNFATIYTAMNRKEIEIDFTKCKNKVILLVGANGSGKTSILSSLHPYAYVGSLDIRNNTGLIRDGEDGYKEIHYQKDNDVYIIKHFYMFSKKNSTLKSFIMKNGVELNPNGNVGSFNDVVSIELSLKQDFLRLVRLGSNVNNLIDLKATERKAFTSNLLTDMNIYAELFKKISEDARVTRGLIKSVSDKITRLNISDISITQNEIDDILIELGKQEKLKESYQKELGALEGNINILAPDGVDKLNEDLQQTISEKKKTVTHFNKLGTRLDESYIICTTDNPDGEIKNTENRINELNNNKQVAENMILFYKEQLNKLYDTKDTIMNKIKLMVSDDEYYKLLDLKVELMQRIDNSKKRFGEGYKPVYSKDELLLLLNKLTFINNIAKEIYEFDDRALSMTIQLLKDGENVDKYISSERHAINSRLASISTKVKMDTNIDQPTVLFVPSQCNVFDCPFKYLYELISGTDTPGESDISELSTKKDILDEMESIHKNIDYIFMIIKSNITLIEKGDIPYFKISSVLDRLSNKDDLFNEDDMTNMISDAEDYEDYLKSQDELQKVLAEIKALNGNKNNMSGLKSELETVEFEISKMLATINDKESDIIKIDNDITSMSDILYILQIYHEYNMIRDVILKELDSKINTIESVFNKINDTASRANDVKGLIKNVDWTINKLNDDLFTKKVAIQEFKKLSEEKDILNDKFDDIEVIREALSSTKGIPLLYIQLYLKNTTIYVNNLLQSVYGDDFAIDDFEINSTEFNIPYIKNGIRINDVAFASQGEKSFLSLALSFALINQSIKDYNVLLLDEIDSTLDPKNRAMFLNILEKQMEIISADQIFLITHNNMFDSYPVDVILTSGSKLENYNNANIIYSND